MTASKRLHPIESFGPEILALLVRGSKEPVTIEGLTYRDAVKLRFRLQQLRLQMRLQSHPLSTVVTRSLIQIIWGADASLPAAEESRTGKNVRFPKDRQTPCKVVVRPRDSEFSDSILRAGITPAELQEEVLPAITSNPLAEARDFLSQFSKKGE